MLEDDSQEHEDVAMGLCHTGQDLPAMIQLSALRTSCFHSTSNVHALKHTRPHAGHDRADSHRHAAMGCHKLRGFKASLPRSMWD